MALVLEQKQEPGCSTNSNCSGLKLNQSAQRAPSCMLSPDMPENRTISPSGGYVRGNTKNDLPQSRLPPSVSTWYNKEMKAMYRLNQVNRSASSREFGRLNQRKDLQWYKLED